MKFEHFVCDFKIFSCYF